MRKWDIVQNELAQMRIFLERLDVALITRYPDSERAADEYVALRRGVMAMGSASTRQRSGLVSLVNLIDEGASLTSVRGRISDLLSTLDVSEISPSEALSKLGDQLAFFFQEVGDEAHERSAWIQPGEVGLDLVQKGYLRAFPRVDASSIEENATLSAGGAGTQTHLVNDQDRTDLHDQREELL